MCAIVSRDHSKKRLNQINSSSLQTGHDGFWVYQLAVLGYNLPFKVYTRLVTASLGESAPVHDAVED